MSDVVTCLNDRPLENKTSDHLKNYKYAKGLLDFIQAAQTPLTIGIQGGWGSGKTSLINLLREGLKENNDKEGPKTLCIFVNAWEYSLFAAENNRAETAAGLLGGLLGRLSAAVKECQDITTEIKNKIIDKESFLAKARKRTVNFITNITKSAIKYKTLGVIDLFSDQEEGADAQMDVKAIHELRVDINEALEGIKKATSYSRFVFFVDDMDRVHPGTAIEILDVLKNVFDIEDCVFVLAIDFEVVVKGLEGKYGPKTKENEREFRQYFDKIIQIPFTMPIGSYNKYMYDFLDKSFQKMGYEFSEYDERLRENIKNVAFCATDGVPRSVKRIINTLSLMIHIQRLEEEDYSENRSWPDAAGGLKAKADDEGQQYALEAEFIVVALHLFFPEICRCLMAKQNFVEDWTFEELGEPWELEKEHYDYIKNRSKPGESFDEEWERVVYCLCRKHTWYQGREKAASDILNALRNAKKRSSDAGRADEFDERLSEIMDMLRVVSVDDAASDQPAIDDSSLEKDAVSVFCRRLHTALLPSNMLGDEEPKTYAKSRQTDWGLSNGRSYKIETAEDSRLLRLEFQWRPGDEKFFVLTSPYFPYGWTGKGRPQLFERWRKDKTLGGTEKIEHDPNETDGPNVYYLAFDGFASKEDFRKLKPEDYAPKITEFLKAVKITVENICGQ